MSAAVDPPLAGIRVIDAVAGPLAPITRYLADLGAQVDRIVPHDADSPKDIAANTGKRACASPESLQGKFHAIVAGRGAGVDLAALRRQDRALVTMTVSDFGTGNAFSGWKASGAVLHALTGVLSRSGQKGKPPLMPPAKLAYECAAVQAAYALLAAIYRALRCGEGAHFDFSALDGAMQALDPGFGINGSATLGRPIGLLSRHRPAAGFQYPIFPCADGHVRICLLSKRQWRGMFEWMGRPEQFASPEFDKTVHRYKSPDLLPFIARFLKGKRREEAEREGGAHGVPVSGLNSLGEYFDSAQLAARGALQDAEGGTGARLPKGVLSIDGRRAAFGNAGAELALPGENAIDRPFAGLRVLDLGIIVVGAEQGRLLADYGADVIKIESRAFPDGNRQSYLDFGMSVSFAAGHRNKRSLGIDLRSDEGHELFLDLVARADVVCSNFKPGTMEKLGLGKDVLMAANPAIVVSESSAFGDSGPWSDRMGYGPLVRAATGLTGLWRYPDEPDGFCDGVTVYPDHVAGRVCAIGVVALLIRRLRTGQGGASSVAQNEVMLAHFAEEVIRHSGAFEPDAEQTGPSGVFAAAGDDEWCVVDVRDASERAALCALLGSDGTSLDADLESWLARTAPDAAADALQAAGVPAAKMLRVADLPDFAYYRERGFYRVESHPWLREGVLGEGFIVPSDDIALPPAVAAPLAGEQTEAVVAQWLGLGDAEIERLCRAGVLEPLTPETRQSAQAHIVSSAA